MPKVKYGWKGRFPSNKIDPQKAGQCLAALHKRHKHLNAELVVDEAVSPTSPLHDAFEWDNTLAAEAHRLEQARGLIRAVVVLRDNGQRDHPIRAFVHITDAADEPVYMDIKVAMSDKVMRQQVLQRAWKELEGWRERYAEYQELAAVFAAVDRERAKKAS